MNVYIECVSCLEKDKVDEDKLVDVLKKIENVVNSLDFYEILLVERTASLDDVKKARKRMNLLFHPDKLVTKEKVRRREKS